MRSPLHLYGRMLRGEAATYRVCFQDGSLRPLPVARYLGAADDVDRRLLADVDGPVLDVGCGPGRHLRALAARGVFALGVDLSPVAVELARSAGSHAVVGDIFGELPGAGTWRTALLLDGNIGIGGSPERLLSRVGALLHPSGQVLVELEPPGEPTVTLPARLEAGGEASAWFPWARVSTPEIGALARAGGLRAGDPVCAAGRWFTRLRPRAEPAEPGAVDLADAPADAAAASAFAA